MDKIDFRFNGFKLTSQDNGTHHLVLYVSNDAVASIIQPILQASECVNVRYNIVNNYFDLYINMPNNNSYYEMNLHHEESTNILAYAIDMNKLTDLWVGYQKQDETILWALSIPLGQ